MQDRRRRLLLIGVGIITLLLEASLQPPSYVTIPVALAAFMCIGGAIWPEGTARLLKGIPGGPRALRFLEAKETELFGDASSTTAMPATEPDLTGCLQVGARFKDTWAEIIVRNISDTETLEDVDVTLANYSVDLDHYTPRDVLRRLKTQEREGLPPLIHARDQKYFRIGRVTHNTDGYKFHFWNAGPLEGNVCAIKVRIAARRVPARNWFWKLTLEESGELRFEPYRRAKGKA